MEKGPPLCLPIGNDSHKKNHSSLYTSDPQLPMIELPSDPSRLVTDLIDNPQYGKHLGWIMAQRSASALRSHNNPTIMLVGLSGAGKSTTINRLFNSDICDIGCSRSTTNGITEHFVEIPSLRSGINNLRLSVIDTPGFHDTAGIDSDAIHAVCMQKFIKFPGFSVCTHLIVCHGNSPFALTSHASPTETRQRSISVRRSHCVFPRRQPYIRNELGIC
ncbi:hypothetical protein BC938DRAFT_479496 [Jimgerdemannia flammicorona]|uniref:Septin-type G domain-containing protein n=1 Tax=Jimgerdemannia flammicorona TaxID=994334 RepID=A0A433QKR8_9FUNG|nr:hypothetical protein BC938DRAFT_479496 [Jimgerdemannia flammicorona]